MTRRDGRIRTPDGGTDYTDIVAEAFQRIADQVFMYPRARMSIYSTADEPPTYPVCEFCRLLGGGHKPGCPTQVATSLPDDTQADRHHPDRLRPQWPTRPGTTDPVTWVAGWSAYVDCPQCHSYVHADHMAEHTEREHTP